MSKSSKRWLREHNRDRYVNQARRRQLRSRAVFKLEELDRRYRLFHRGQTVIDLGAAPGSWSAYVSKKVNPGGTVIAVDILDMEPLAGVTFLRRDLSDMNSRPDCLGELAAYRADLVISDMAPNLSGIAAADQANSLNLAQTAAQVSYAALRAGGHFLVKLFQGNGVADFRKQLNKQFDKVILAKPKASKAHSSEVYLLAQGYESTSR